MQQPTSTLPTKLPTAENEERTLIARALTRKENALKLIGLVDEDAFFNEKNKLVFLAMKSLVTRAQDPDITMVSNELKGSTVSLSDLASYAAYEMPGGYATVEALATIVTNTAKERKLIQLAHRAIKDIGEHKQDVLPSLISNLLELDSAQVQKTSYGSKDLAQTFVESMDSRRLDGGMAGIPYGFAALDYFTKGAQPGQLVIIGGRPSNGKSALSENIALNMMNRGARVLFFSLETPAQGISDRMIGRLTGLGHEDIKRGFDHNEARTELIMDKATEYSEFPWTIIDDPTITSEQILSISTQYKMQNKLDVIFVDYLQLVRSGKYKGDSRNEAVGRISANLKITARSLNVPVIVTAQLNRGAEEGSKPELHHLRESGNIEADADVAMLIYRGDRDKEPNTTYLDIAKNRDGKTGLMKLGFEGKTVSFYNVKQE
jgi:replicative DNA helicase